MKQFFFIPFMIVALVPGFGQHHERAAIPETVPVSFRTILQQSLPASAFKGSEVKMLIVNFPPRSASPAHRHPCPTFGYMLQGEIESVFEGQVFHYKPGDVFYERANGLHSAARNTHPTDTARLLVFYIAEKNKPTSVPEK